MKPADTILQYYLPKSLSKQRLDRYLAAGWFRTTNMLFRSQVTCFENDICSPINIRLPLQNHEHPKRLRKLLNRNNKVFRYEIQKATITPEKEKLFYQHQNRFRSFLCNSLEEFLVPTYRFDTHEIAVYDEDMLVAVSFFDEGQQSLMSLLGLFDPGYASYSLGIYTMLLEIEYGKATGRRFYYPGYVHEVPSIYDYKLRLGEVEAYNWETKRWHRGVHPHTMPNATVHIKKRTDGLMRVLQAMGLPFQFKINLFFGWHYYNATFGTLFRCPLMLVLNDNTVIAYDPDSNCYIHIRLEIHIPFRDIHLQLAPDFNRNIHCLDVMKEQYVIFYSPSLNDLVGHLNYLYGTPTIFHQADTGWLAINRE